MGGGRAAPHSSQPEGKTDLEGAAAAGRTQHHSHTECYRGAGTGDSPPASSAPPSPPGTGRIPGAAPWAGRKGDMHTDPALLPRAGKGGEEEEEEEGLQQHLSSSGWSRRLGRCTGTPLVLGISGITVGREGIEWVMESHPTLESCQPQSRALHAAAPSHEAVQLLSSAGKRLLNPYKPSQGRAIHMQHRQGTGRGNTPVFGIGFSAWCSRVKGSPKTSSSPKRN